MGLNVILLSMRGGPAWAHRKFRVTHVAMRLTRGVAHTQTKLRGAVGGTPLDHLTILQ